MYIQRKYISNPNVSVYIHAYIHTYIHLLHFEKILKYSIFQTKTLYDSPFHYFQQCQFSKMISNIEILNIFGNDTITKDSIYSPEKFPVKREVIAVFSAIILEILRQIPLLIQPCFRHLISYGLQANSKTSFLLGYRN